MSFFSTQKKEGKSAVIFLSSGSIEAGIFSDASKINKLDLFVKENFKFIQNIDPDALEKETFLSLGKVLKKILTENSKKINNKKINRIFFVLGAPWYISTSISIDIKKSNAFFVNKDEIIKELELKNLENNEDYTVIESRIVSILANGYEIKDIKGKRAKHVSAKAISNLSEKRILKKIDHETQKFFPEAYIKVSTLPSISVEEISEKINKKNYLLVLSEDEITEICLIKDKRSIESISVPFGKNTFLRAMIDQGLATDSNSADSMLKMFEEGHIASEKKENIEKIMNETSLLCSKILKESLFRFIGKGSYPDSVAILNSSKEANLVIKNIFNDYYINNIGHKDFAKILLSKDLNESVLFSVAVSGIKSLYF
ncbi:MAG: hypothetical protein WCV55_02220 [Candidatus Paceibacterota bacterium]